MVGNGYKIVGKWMGATLAYRLRYHHLACKIREPCNEARICNSVTPRTGGSYSYTDGPSSGLEWRSWRPRTCHISWAELSGGECTRS